MVVLVAMFSYDAMLHYLLRCCLNYVIVSFVVDSCPAAMIDSFIVVLPPANIVSCCAQSTYIVFAK